MGTKKQLKSRTEEWKEQVELLSEVATLLLKLSIAFGGLLLAGYAGKEGFFYDVSSLSNVAALVFVTLSFAFVVAFATVCGAFVLLGPFALLLRLFSMRETRLIPPLAHWSLRLMSGALCIFLAIIILLAWLNGNTINWALIEYSIWAGLMLLFVLGTETGTPTPKSPTGFSPENSPGVTGMGQAADTM